MSSLAAPPGVWEELTIPELPPARVGKKYLHTNLGQNAMQDMSTKVEQRSKLLAATFPMLGKKKTLNAIVENAAAKEGGTVNDNSNADETGQRKRMKRYSNSSALRLTRKNEQDVTWEDQLMMRICKYRDLIQACRVLLDDLKATSVEFEKKLSAALQEDQEQEKVEQMVEDNMELEKQQKKLKKRSQEFVEEILEEQGYSESLKLLFERATQRRRQKEVDIANIMTEIAAHDHDITVLSAEALTAKEIAMKSDELLSEFRRSVEARRAKIDDLITNRRNLHEILKTRRERCQDITKKLEQAREEVEEAKRLKRAMKDSNHLTEEDIILATKELMFSKIRAVFGSLDADEMLSLYIDKHQSIAVMQENVGTAQKQVEDSKKERDRLKKLLDTIHSNPDEFSEISSTMNEKLESVSRRTKMLDKVVDQKRLDILAKKRSLMSMKANLAALNARAAFFDGNYAPLPSASSPSTASEMSDEYLEYSSTAEAQEIENLIAALSARLCRILPIVNGTDLTKQGTATNNMNGDDLLELASPGPSSSAASSVNNSPNQSKQAQSRLGHKRPASLLAVAKRVGSEAAMNSPNAKRTPSHMTTSNAPSSARNLLLRNAGASGSFALLNKDNSHLNNNNNSSTNTNNNNNNMSSSLSHHSHSSNNSVSSDHRTMDGKDDDDEDDEDKPDPIRDSLSVPDPDDPDMPVERDAIKKRAQRILRKNDPALSENGAGNVPGGRKKTKKAKRIPVWREKDASPGKEKSPIPPTISENTPT